MRPEAKKKNFSVDYQLVSGWDTATLLPNWAQFFRGLSSQNDRLSAH